jgi:excisionase family DNA binding protein
MRWLTPEQYGELMQLSPKAVRRLCRDGLIRAKKVGQQWRIHPKEVE